MKQKNIDVNRMKQKLNDLVGVVSMAAEIIEHVRLFSLKSHDSWSAESFRSDIFSIVHKYGFMTNLQDIIIEAGDFITVEDTQTLSSLGYDPKEEWIIRDAKKTFEVEKVEFPFPDLRHVYVKGSDHVFIDADIAWVVGPNHC